MSTDARFYSCGFVSSSLSHAIDNYIRYFREELLTEHARQFSMSMHDLTHEHGELGSVRKRTTSTSSIINKLLSATNLAQRKNTVASATGDSDIVSVDSLAYDNYVDPCVFAVIRVERI